MVCIMILVPALAKTAVPALSIVTSQGRAVYVMLNYAEDANEGIPGIKARLEQDLHVIENVFQHHVIGADLPSLHQTTNYDNNRPVLLIRAAHPTTGDPPVTEGAAAFPIATLSRTSVAALISSFPVMEGPAGTPVGGGIKDVQNLGQAYLIDTTTDRISFNDLLAFVLLLPRLIEQSPVLTVNTEILAQIKNSREYLDFRNLELTLGHPGMWNHEGKSFSPVWQAGVLSYYVSDLAGNKLFKLEPLEYYLARPGWSPPIPRFVSGATEKEIFFVDTFSAKTHRLDLTALFPDKYLEMSESIELTTTPQGDRIYFTLSFNLPEEFWETEKHSYVYDLLSGKIVFAPPGEPISPQAPEAAREPTPGVGVGVIVEPYVDVLPGYISPVWQLRGKGWPSGQLNRRESFLAGHWADLLPKQDRLVFLPASFLNQSRFIAYASQAEILVYETITQKYHRLDLKGTRPADYKKISALRFAQNPNSPEDKIHIFLEEHNQTVGAYIWDLSANKLEQIDKTLAQIQRDGQAGWWEFTPGTVSFALPPGTLILTGYEAREAIIREFFAHLANVSVALSLWLGVFFFIFLLPFVLANATALLAALKLKNSRLYLGLAPALTAIFFIGFSILALLLTMPYTGKIESLVFPLPWFSIGMNATVAVFMFGFLIVVAAALTILIFRESRLLFRSLFHNTAGFGMVQAGRSVAISASVVYGLAGAVLLLLLFALAALRLPSLLPADPEPLFIMALFYALCLAVTLFLLKAPPAFAGYLTAAAAFLGIGVFGHSSFRFAGSVSGYSLSEAAAVLTHGDWLGNFALILPQVLICLVYLSRIWLEHRGRTLKMPSALAMAALIAFPATYIVLFAERLHWDVPKLGYFALPAALVLIALTAVSFVAALIQLYRYSGKEPLPQPLPPAESQPPMAPAPALKKLTVPIGPIMTGIAALLVFIILMTGALKGISFMPGGWGLLLLLLCFIISSVFYFGCFLTVRLAKLLFKTGRTPVP